MSAWKQAFDVINLALGAISTAGNTPGVNLIPYVSTVAAAAGALKAGLNAAVNIAPYVAAITETFSGELPSASQLAALDAKIAELEVLVAAPLPPKEDGEED
jgi:hypothetical protein